MRAHYLLATDDALIQQCEVDRYRASGPGGQHRNKTESAVRLRHKLTGVTAIGDDSYSELEVAIPGDTVEAQVATLSQTMQDLTGAPLSTALRDRLNGAGVPAFGLSLRIRGGKIVRVGGLAPGMAIKDIEALCTDAKVGFDPKLPKIVGALGAGIARVEYGRAGERAGVDVYIDPGESAAKQEPAAATDSN